MDPGRRADMLKQNLSLTDDQTSQVKTIFEDSRTKMEAVRSNSSLSQDDRRSQMMSLRKAENDKVDALLTPDQKTKYAAHAGSRCAIGCAVVHRAELLMGRRRIHRHHLHLRLRRADEEPTTSGRGVITPRPFVLAELWKERGLPFR